MKEYKQTGGMRLTVEQIIKRQDLAQKKKASPVNKTREDASGFRTTLPPEHVYKIKVTTSQGIREGNRYSTSTGFC